MSVNEWCQQHDITKANYYYRLRRVREAYLSSVKTPITEFVEMPVSNITDDQNNNSSVSAVLHVKQDIAIDIFDTASVAFIQKLIGAISHAE